MNQNSLKHLMRVIGLAAFLWVSYLLFQWGEFIWSEYQVNFMDYSFMRDSWKNYKDPKNWISYIPILLSFAVLGWTFIGCVGLVFIQPWARFLFVSIIYVYIVGALAVPFFWLGSFVGTSWYISNSLVIGLLLLIFSRKPIAELFPYKRSLEWHVPIFLIMMLVIPGLFFVLWKNIDGDDFKFIPAKGETIFEEKFEAKHLFRPDFPFTYSVALPDKSVLAEISDSHFSIFRNFEFYLDKNKLNRCRFSFGIYNESFFPFSTLGRPMGFQSTYPFAKRYYSEKYGYRVLKLKIERMQYRGVTIQERRVNGLNVFILQSKRNYRYYERKKDKKPILYRRLHVFDDKKFLGSGHIYCDDSAMLELIISSIKPVDKAPKTAPEYFKEGLQYAKNKDYEKASVAFGAAIFIYGKENDLTAEIKPEYLLRFAQAIVKTDFGGCVTTGINSISNFNPRLPGTDKLLATYEKKKKAYHAKFPKMKRYCL